MTPVIHPFFDSQSGTVSYLVHAAGARDCAIIDPVLDYDAAAGRTSTPSAQRVVDHVRREGLEVAWILETHAHADHLSAAAWLKRTIGGRTAIGAQIRQVQAVFNTLFHLQDEGAREGRPFDHLFDDGEEFQVGPLTGKALHVPGHTPADMAYQFGDCVFVGDTLFLPDVGTARCDFPGGDASTLYASIQRLLALPPATRLFMCHDYPPAGRAPAWECTVADQRADNVHVHDGVDLAAFRALREARDATLGTPALLLPAIQVNIRAGELPPPETDGRHYLKVPVNAP